MSFFKSVKDFMLANPALTWLIMSAFITALFRQRSDEELAKFPKPVATVLRLIAALGLDSAAVMGAMRKPVVKVDEKQE